MASVDYRDIYPKGQDSGNRRRVLCWHHEDASPSLDIDLTSGVYKCRSCGEAGNAIRYITEILHRKPEEFGLGKSISEAEVERYHAALLSNPEAMAYLKSRRGVDPKTVKAWKVGYEESTGRIVFPIRDASGTVVNLRKYLPNAPKGTPKTISLKGHGGSHLHPIDLLRRSEQVVLTAGETDWLVAMSRGITAVTQTGGEDYWNDAFTAEFAGKDVSICYDVDEAGRRGAARVAEQLHGKARTVRVIDLAKAGIVEEKFPHGDLSDYFNQLTPKPTLRDWLHLVAATRIFSPANRDADIISPLDDETVYEVDFPRAVLAQYASRRVKFNAHVQGMDKIPFVIPKDLTMTCSENAGKLCERCMCAGKGGRVDKSIEPDEPRVLHMFRCSEMQQKGYVRDLFGIPVRCQQHTITPTKFINLEEVHLVREVGTAQELSEADDDKYATRLAYYAYPEGEEGLDWNASYTMEARTVPEPTKQYAVHLVYKAQPKEDDLSKFQLDAPRVKELKKLLNPKKWKVADVSEKMESIADDFARNVSRIYGRPDVHIAVDLAYHSVLFFDWEGKSVRGWMDILIIGDTRQGKSESVMSFRRHAALGDRVDCSRATVAGLIGGAHELIKGHWTIEWGAIPLGDRMLVILEEVKVLEPEKIGALKEARSSGIAEVTAIRRDRTFARTRKIWISNPRSSRKMETYSYGVEAVKELVGNPEDVARFDYVVAVADSNDEVPRELLNRFRDGSERGQSATYDAGCYRDTVLFAWSRRSDDVLIDDDTRRAILESARTIADLYDDDFPLVQVADFRFKLARVAIAAAIRTFSVDDSGTKVIVRPCHVEYAAKFLRSLFDKRSLGYKLYSQDQKKAKTLDNADEIKATIRSVTYPDALRDSILRARYFNRSNVANWSGLNKDDADGLVAMLERNRAIFAYDSSKYVKSPAFINLLREMQNER